MGLKSIIHLGPFEKLEGTEHAIGEIGELLALGMLRNRDTERHVGGRNPNVRPSCTEFRHGQTVLAADRQLAAF